MYDFNEDEFKRYRDQWLFNRAMQEASKAGLSKEEAYFQIIKLLLDLKDAAFQEKVNELVWSNAPLSFSFDKENK